MSARMLVPLALVAVLSSVSSGCKDKPVRRDPLQRAAPPPGAPRLYPDHLDTAQQPFTPPAPPSPPPLPGITPPRSGEMLTIRVPPMPTASAPTELPPPQPQPSNTLIAAANTAPPPDERPVPTFSPPSAPSPSPVGRVRSEPPAPLPVAASSPAAAPADTVASLVAAANEKWATATNYECRFVKREVVNGRKMPQDEIAYKVRKTPLSVSMTVLSEVGRGREVVFVKGRDDRGMHVVTGDGDNRLVGAGYKTTIDPNGAQATAKSRYRVFDAGFGRTLGGLQRAVVAGTAKSLGKVQRPEYPYPLDGIEVAFRPGEDPTLPRGGARQVFLDSKPDSPSYRMPVLVVTTEPNGQEVEYYLFDRVKMPAGLTDADFDPARIGKGR
ncbi:MAG: DUF1571 domain-containing protein [Fimbriiglobus sp.]